MVSILVDHANETNNMVDVILSQREADQLLEMEKYRLDNKSYFFPSRGNELSIPLRSNDNSIEFILDIGRGNIDLSKIKYQNRVYVKIPLTRIDLGFKPHKNPDDEIISGPHIHIYREGYDDKWAYDLSKEPYCEYFTDISNKWQLLDEFYSFCRIVDPPVINGGISDD